MPIYEYECPHCGHVFEEWVKKADDVTEEPCPTCGTLSKRLISHTSFVLKGGGWYVTEYGYRKNVHEDQNPGEKKSEDATKSDAKGSESGKGDGQKKDTTPKQEGDASKAKESPDHGSAGKAKDTAQKSSTNDSQSKAASTEK